MKRYDMYSVSSEADKLHGVADVDMQSTGINEDKIRRVQCNERTLIKVLGENYEVERES